MLKEKNTQLKDRLSRIIDELGRTSKYADDIKQDITSEFKSRNLNATRASFAMSGNLDLNMLSDSDDDIKFLFLFTYSLNKSLEGKEPIEINVEDYFTKIEVQKWVDYREDIPKESIFPYVFKNVDMFTEGHWQCIVPAQEVERLNASNMLLYNPNTQRDLKVTKSGIRIRVYPKKINQIAQRLLSGEQFADHIKINIVKNGEDRVLYNPKNRTLTVYEGSTLNTFDGQNRKEGNAKALKENPNLNFNWGLVITNFSEIKTHAYMTQINKQTPISEESLEPKDYSKNENRVVDAIMDLNGELSKATKDTDDYIKSNRGLTTKGILAQAIIDNYTEQIELSYNISDVARWIGDFTDYLMGIYIDEFLINPYSIKDTSMINHKKMFFGYIALSSILQNESNWRELLKQKMESIDFNIDNPIWRTIGVNNNRDTNKATRNKLYHLFKEGISNV